MFPAVLQLQVGDSRWQRRSLIVLHLMAGSALLLAALPIAMRAVGMIGLLVSLLHSLKTRPAIRMRCQSDGSLLLDHGDRTEGAWRHCSYRGTVTCLRSTLCFVSRDHVNGISAAC
jgi:hypothetical protein